MGAEHPKDVSKYEKWERLGKSPRGEIWEIRGIEQSTPLVQVSHQRNTLAPEHHGWETT